MLGSTMSHPSENLALLKKVVELSRFRVGGLGLSVKSVGLGVELSDPGLVFTA